MPLGEPLISVLLPTRNRPEMLAQSIDSMLYYADYPECIEFLLAVDPDAVTGLPAGALGEVWVAPQRYGSARMHEYYNHLATLATGKWLMIWNDDALMQTAHWDGIVRQHENVCLWPDHMGTGPAHCNMFPLWPRAWTAALGHIANGSPRVDTWIQEVAEVLNKQVKVPIEVWHHPGVHDQTWDEGREYFLPEFHALRGLRIQEANTLLQLGF
jgi:hypothetical protein